jgi:hypothetical protein
MPSVPRGQDAAEVARRFCELAEEGEGTDVLRINRRDLAMFELLAQEAPSIGDWGTIGGLVASLGSSGILGWYLWYRTSIADPATRKAEAEERTKERADFREELRAIRDRGDAMANRGFIALDKMCDSIDALAQRVDRMSVHCKTEKP